MDCNQGVGCVLKPQPNCAPDFREPPQPLPLPSYNQQQPHPRLYHQGSGNQLYQQPLYPGGFVFF